MTIQNKIDEAVHAFNEYGSQGKAAKALGISRRTLRDRLRRAAKNGTDGLAFHPVPYGHTVKGISTYYNKDGIPRSQWIKTKTEERNFEDFVEYLKEAFKECDGLSKLINGPSTADNDLLTVYPIADIHHGMLAWGEESGEDWDINIGKKIVEECVSNLVYQSKPSKHALILNLGDFFHTNDAKNMTPRSGNILDVDSRYMKMVKTGVLLMINIIECALQKHQFVTVRNLPGNHDQDSCVALTVALSAYFSNNPRVFIDDNPSEFFFMQFGNTLIGGNHGHRLKPADMAMKMACEKPKEWGSTKYRWFLFGHIHHETLKEVGNVRCESFQTIAAKDAHAANSGYMSGRSMSAVTIHNERGEIGRHRVNL